MGLDLIFKPLTLFCYVDLLLPLEKNKKKFLIKCHKSLSGRMTYVFGDMQVYII